MDLGTAIQVVLDNVQHHLQEDHARDLSQHAVGTAGVRQALCDHQSCDSSSEVVGFELVAQFLQEVGPDIEFGRDDLHSLRDLFVGSVMTCLERLGSLGRAEQAMCDVVSSVESRLTIEEWLSFLTALLGDGGVRRDGHEIKDAVVVWCQERVLLGPAATAAEGYQLLHVQAVEDFLYRLEFRYLIARDEAEACLASLQEYDSLFSTIEQLRTSAALADSDAQVAGPTLRDWVVWSAVEYSSPLRSKISANRLIDRLGLDARYDDVPIAVFRYRLPEGVFALFPRFVEACAGIEWNALFRPAAPGSLFGLTCARTPALHGLPEVVNEPVSIEYLSEAVELLEPDGRAQ